MSVVIRIPNLGASPWQKRVVSRLSTPPLPVTGNRYLVIATATDDWVGKENKITWYDGTNWQFIAPTEGFELWVDNEKKFYYYDGSLWDINPVAGYDPELHCIIEKL